jgi:hypothetical protein
MISKLKLTVLLATVLYCSNIFAQAKNDSTFDASVVIPAYTKTHPKILFDQAHNNYHKADGTYASFAHVAENDGYKIVINNSQLTVKSLKENKILVIANAKGPSGKAEQTPFTDDECEAIKAWVEKGGSLLLITDHYPFGLAVEKLAKQFNVQFQNGMLIDTVYFDKPSGDESQIVYSKENGLLPQSEITKGLSKVVSFTGQSITRDGAYIPLLKVSDNAQDYSVEIKQETVGENTRTSVKYVNPVSAKGRCQAIAFNFGNGKVIVTGEAAMLSAQINGQGKQMGMNYPCVDNKQFVLNILYWLSTR